MSPKATRKIPTQLLPKRRTIEDDGGSLVCATFAIGLAQMSNHLANETSPYLLQHVNSPVDWYL